DPFKTETVIERQEFDDLKVNTIVRRKDSGQNILQEYRSESDPVNRTNTYTIVDPEGVIPSYTSTYTYRYNPSNTGGETITITDSLGRQSTVTKNKNGKVVEEVDFAGNKNEYQYENGNIIKKIEYEKKEDGTFETYTTGYKYNAFDQVEEIKEYDNELAEPLITVFIYNDMGKLNNIRDSEGNTT
ncbi:MAG: hypothetical protein GY757_05185, partial [bacterium]|nr:hypothetical protein [bacterium]